MLEISGLNILDDAIAGLTKFKSQLPFAMSLAVNNTAKLVQYFEVSSQLPSKLTLRNQWFKPGSRFGINIKFSNKENLTATVGSRAWWLQLPEFGGTKTPKAGGRFVLTPDSSIRQTSKTLVPKSLKPKKILANKKSEAFLIKSGDKEILFQRTGPGRNELKPLYYGKPSTQVAPRLSFESSAREKVREVYATEFQKAFKQAVSSAFTKG